MARPEQELQTAIDRYRGSLVPDWPSDIGPLVPDNPLAPAGVNEPPYAALARQLDKDNGGKVGSAVMRWADARVSLWERCVASGEEWQKPHAERELHRYDPLNPRDAVAITWTAWTLQHDLTERRFLAADPGRMPSSLAGAQVVTAEQEATERALYGSRADVLWFELDGASVATKQQFLQAVWQVMHFPDHHWNWDALLDWLRDMEWLPAMAYVLVIRNASQLWQRLPQDAWTFTEIWLDAAVMWKGEGVPFRLLLVW